MELKIAAIANKQGRFCVSQYVLVPILPERDTSLKLFQAHKAQQEFPVPRSAPAPRARQQKHVMQRHF